MRKSNHEGHEEGSDSDPVMPGLYFFVLFAPFVVHFPQERDVGQNGPLCSGVLWPSGRRGEQFAQKLRQQKQ